MYPQTGAFVISVDYAKSPKYPYPHALLQTYEVLKWTLSTASSPHGIEVDPGRVAIMGNSAGGNLTASLSLLLSFTSGSCAHFRRQLPSGFVQVLQVLLYPSLEQYTRYNERLARTDEAAKARSLPARVAELMEDSYLPGYIDRRSMFVAPLATGPELLKSLRLRSALILRAGLDCLKDEALAFGDKLTQAGVSVDGHEYPDAIHGFSHYVKGADFRADDVRDCWERIIDALKAAFRPG